MLAYAQRLWNAADLQHGANAGVSFGARRIAPEDRKLARGWPDEPEQELNGRRFSGAIRSQQGDQLTRAHLESEINERSSRTIGLVHAGELRDFTGIARKRSQ